MLQPKLLSKPWATDGLKNDIPTLRGTGLAQEAATYAEGFPSITMTPISVGGKPPSGKDMNGILYEVSAHIVYTNKGQRYCFDQTFCTSIGGYPKGAVLMNDAGTAEYISLIDRNTANFNLTTVNIAGQWAIYAGEGAIPAATTTGRGLTQLSSATNSNAEDRAATPKAIKTVLDALTNLDGRSFKQYGALSSRNLNDLKGDANYGVWHETANAAATPERNYPTTKAGTLYVLPSAYQGQQIYYPLDQNVFYKRHSLPNGSWSAWHTMCEVIDSPSSTSTTAAASANQVKRLNDRAANIENTKFDKTGGIATGHIAVQYTAEHVGFSARNPTEGKHGYYDVQVGGYNRGGFEIIGAGNGEYKAQIRVTAPGEVAQDRRTVGIEIRHNEISTEAYGKLHEAFVRASANVAQTISGDKKFTGTVQVTAPAADANNDQVPTTAWIRNLNNSLATKNITITAGNGLTGGGDLSANRAFALGTPSQITATSTNTVTTTSHTHAIDKASLTVAGIVQLNSATNSNAENLAATPKAVNAAYDRATQAAHSGMIAYFARNAAPEGWLKCNGAAVSRTTYAALFAAIGTTFGTGDGSTTFNLPDLRGEFLRGWDDGRGIDTGRAFGSAQNDAFQGHARNLKRSQSDARMHGLNYYQNVEINNNPHSPAPAAINNGDTWLTHDYLPHLSYGTPRVAAETRPRNIALLACIKI